MADSSLSDAEFDAPLIGAIDQGTSSTRFLIFSARSWKVIASEQIELKQIYPKEGWMEMDPGEILNSTLECIKTACEKLRQARFDVANIRAVGITNQRETTVVWNRRTGQHLYNAIVWSDMRTASLADEFTKKAPGGRKNAFDQISGLVIHPYFSALKIRWIMDNVPDVKKEADENNLCAGTIDSWLVWNLTKGQVFATDVTNASRTMLMNLRTLKWDRKLLNFYGVDEKILPEIRSSAESYGEIVDGPLKGVKISGVLGDQQAALVGERCLQAGMAKSTYGTGCFMLCNTGTKPVISKNGLLATVGYKMGPDADTFYALEGSVAVAGNVVRWLRDQMGIIKNSAEIEKLAKSVETTDGVYFVPAFSGLFAPYWHPQARGVICGLTQKTTKAHVARAALESICFQTRELTDAMRDDTGSQLTELNVDGGMVKNALFLQTLADILNKKIVRADMVESSCLGAAMAAAIAVGVYKLDQPSTSPVQNVGAEGTIFQPKIDEKERERRFKKWKDAVQRSMNWTDDKCCGATSKCASSKCSFYCQGFVLLSSALAGGVLIGIVLSRFWR